MPRPRESSVDPDVLTLADLRHALDKKERELRELLARKEKLAGELDELGEILQAMLVGSDAAAGRPAPAHAPQRRPAGKAAHAAHAEKPERTRRKRKAAAAGAARGAREGSLQAVIRSVLERVIGPLRVSEIVHAVQQSGYASKSANLNVIVGNRLAQMEDVEKVDRGLYQLKRAAASTPPEPPPLASAATA